ncbi:hypothetical protein L226DRAFT_305662 [Lentinus tigrinus ALCF2SS1-7]|uniref:uncharacterized protein n=1 Tax=Lentinus tigrinus ALCF2SS1-7 TaxID=1328758 RepID=UPI0011661BAE|nr:hypothetical protein L226DRAFT_305662 [Lentinus tigrinus ALCF2SS1-7]
MPYGRTDTSILNSTQHDSCSRVRSLYLSGPKKCGSLVIVLYTATSTSTLLDSVNTPFLCASTRSAGPCTSTSIAG